MSRLQPAPLFDALIAPYENERRGSDSEIEVECLRVVIRKLFTAEIRAHAGDENAAKEYANIRDALIEFADSQEVY